MGADFSVLIKYFRRCLKVFALNFKESFGADLDDSYVYISEADFSISRMAVFKLSGSKISAFLPS